MTSAAHKSKTQLEVERLRAEALSRSNEEVRGWFFLLATWLVYNMAIAVVVYHVLEQSGDGMRLAQSLGSIVRRLGTPLAPLARLIPSQSHFPSLASVARHVHPSVASSASVTLTAIQSHAARLAQRTWVDVELFRTATAASLLVGFLGTARYHHNRKVKNEKNQRLALIPGKLGTQYLLHNIPR